MESKKISGKEIGEILGYTDQTPTIEAVNEMMYLSPRDERFAGRPMDEVIQIIETANYLALHILESRGN